MSFGGRLAQSEQSRRGTRNDGPGLPPRNLIGANAPLQAPRINALPLPARFSRAGRGRGEWGVVLCGKAVR